MTPPRPAAIRPASRRQRYLRRVGNSWLLRRWGPRLLPRLDRQVHRWTNGRWMPSRLLVPVLMLHTTRSDGTACRTPLLAGQTPSGTFIVMATNFGRPRHPAWSYHLLRDPHASVDWHGTALPVRAHLLTAQEQQAVRTHILTWMPCFDDYAHYSRRDIRVFALTPHPHTTDTANTPGPAHGAHVQEAIRPARPKGPPSTGAQQPGRA